MIAVLIVVAIGVPVVVVGSGPECVSCSGVENICSHSIHCAGDEVCYMHHYVTESGDDLLDYGCISTQACPNNLVPIIGRRAEGHHIKCTHCCNTRLCNAKLTCSGDGHIPSTSILPRECADLHITTSGVYTIYPYGKAVPEVSVYCYVDSSLHAWTVIQKRFDGSVSFYRDWQEYKEDFGSPDGEYWLGNEYIHEISSDSNHDLKIILTDFNNVTKFAEYLSFHVSSEANGYRLMVGSYDGNAGDSLTYNNGYKFTTFDRDNDAYSNNCAVEFKGAWWYNACHESNLNGLYLRGHHNEFATGVNWYKWHGHYYSLKSTTMMIRKY